MLDEAFAILREIRARGHLAVVVGGAVRDRLLGRPITDVDLATGMPLEELATLFTTHAVGRSKQFETVLIVRGGRAFEISRFRGAPERAETVGEAALQDDRAVLLRDTAHRDFTINALLLGLNGDVIDLQNRLTDLRNRVVRCVGSPAERFDEDPARILRAVRFAACLGFTIETATTEAMTRGAPRLAAVAGERVGKEILKIASHSGAALADAVELMRRHGVLGVLLPEIGGLEELPLAQPPEEDCPEHPLAALRASSSTDPAVNLAALLNGAGKQRTHAQTAGAGVVAAIARRLRLSRRLAAAVSFAVEQRPRAARFAELRRSEKLALLGSPHWRVLRAATLCAMSARGDSLAREHLDAVFLEAETDAGPLREGRAVAPVVSGSRIMALSCLAPGPLVGEIQRRVSAWAQDNRVRNPELIESEVVRLAAEAAAVGGEADPADASGPRVSP